MKFLSQFSREIRGRFVYIDTPKSSPSNEPINDATAFDSRNPQDVALLVGQGMTWANEPDKTKLQLKDGVRTIRQLKDKLKKQELTSVRKSTTRQIASYAPVVETYFIKQNAPYLEDGKVYLKNSNEGIFLEKLNKKYPGILTKKELKTERYQVGPAG